MHRNLRLVTITTIIFLLFSALAPISLTTDSELPWWDKEWNYREEINIPIDTSLESSQYQPIDVFFDFENPCWAKNENEHSVRIILQEGGKTLELECQIYDLEKSDGTYISSCGIVFLIPKDASGNEVYFVYYDDEQKDSPNYDDHVELKEDYYRYEPVPGIYFESWFYLVLEEGNYIYGVSQKGTARGVGISQQVVKFQKGADDALPTYGEQTASFSFVYYWYKNDKWERINTAEKLVDKQVFVDGNLMVKFAIVSTSADGYIQSTVFYKYYYSPLDDKGIFADVEHKVTNYPLDTGDKVNAAFLVLNTGGIKSSLIEELNFGEIPKFLHFYNDEKGVVTYEMDRFPENTEWQEQISKEDDYDIGSFSWLSIDEGEQGKAHGIIFDSNDVLESGTDESNGIEIELWEAHEIRLPGLDGRFAYIYFMRNSYVEGEEPDNVIPEDYVIKFRAQFFTTEKGGYKKVEEQAKTYQSLVDLQPKNNHDVDGGNGNGEEYKLNVFTHLTQSLWARLIASRFLLKNAYVTVELYKNNAKKAVATAGKIVFTEDYWVDFQNTSLFRKATFPNLSPGRYLIKVFLENSILGIEKEFIGYEFIDISENTDTHVYCIPERKIDISYKDQKDKGIENVETYVYFNDEILIKTSSSPEGTTNIGIPADFNEKYLIKSIYKGFLVDQEEITLGLINRFIPAKKEVTLDVYDYNVEIKNSEENTPSFDVSITLTSDEMDEQFEITPDETKDGVYNFYKLNPTDYKMKIKYNSAEIIEKINIPDTLSKKISFYDFKLFLKDEWDLTPEAALKVTLTSLDFEKTEVFNCECINNAEYLFTDLYPGNYSLKVAYKSHEYKINKTIPNGGNGKYTMTFPIVFDLNANVFDSHGTPLRNAHVVLSRQGKETQGYTDEDGKINFTIPPGTYKTKVYSDGAIVSERNVEVLNEKIYDVVTTVEPVNPYIVFIIAVITLGAVAYICKRRKDPLFFVKVLAIIIAIVALVMPWWSIGGILTKPHLETSTNMYLTPAKMITITENTDVITGEISSLGQDFPFVMNLLPVLIFIGVILILLTVIVRNVLKRKKLSFIVYVISILIFISSLIIFTYAMSELANITVGSFIGNGNIDVNIYAENISESIPCNWGPGIGFYMFISSIIILIIGGILSLKKNRRNKKNSC